MSTGFLRKLGFLVIGVAVALTPALAHGDRHEHRGGERREHFQRHERMEHRMEHRQMERERAREHWRHERMAEHRREWRRPNGWDHGRKNGWRGGDVPPGQARRDGGAPFHHSGSDHAWNRGGSSPAPTSVSSSTSHTDPRSSKMARVLPLGKR